MQAWESFLGNLRDLLGDETLKQWLHPLKVVHFDACNLYLEAQNSFQIDWFEEHIRPLAKKQFRNNNFHPIKIHLTCAELKPVKELKIAPKENPNPPPPFDLILDPLFPEYTEENFIFNTQNQIFPALLKSLIEKKHSFNPLLIYGSSSSGKTHLLQAFALAFKDKGYQTLYVKAETFTENMVKALRTSRMQEFRKAYRHTDILLFDDIQHLAKKTATQEEFFHTFNALHGLGKQIILSSDTLPSLLTEIEPRLISRFEWGLALPIQKLEADDLIKLLQSRAKQMKTVIPLATLKFLVETFASNIKSLQRAFEALILRSNKLQGQTILPPLAERLLEDLMEREKKEALNPETILSYVSHFYGLPTEEILSKSQTQECTTPRQIAMYLCRNELKMPFAKIGDYFKRDHSTVITSVKSIEEKVENQEPDTLGALLHIGQRIK